MSDFLGNLAMKSLGLAPLVQPRPLTAFEALPAEGALAARLAVERPAEPVELETNEVNPERPSTGSGRSTRSEARTQFSDSSPERTAPGSGVEGRTARFDMPSAISVPLAVSLPPAEAVERHAPRAAQPASQPTVQAAPIPAAIPTTQPMAEVQRVAPLPAPLPPARPVAPPANEDEAEPSHTRRVLTPVVQEIKAGLVPSRAVAAEAESPAEPAEAAPTISVTIGRVEVRAALAPRSAPEGRRERRAAPSLDDYLRMRSGGKP